MKRSQLQQQIEATPDDRNQVIEDLTAIPADLPFQLSPFKVS
ncbi:hypothetical protein OOK60_00225 [Trichothermofontia sichuanensis B231]|nr:hypothetical protein [Trichothermofontia sichuanensis]UZQ54542.1 hypothetical protein OOK60_00225 [Trichothermofontia sichuanensis B231]